MPHVMFEYTQILHPQVNEAGLLHQIHHAVLDSGLFAPEAVKSRTIAHEEVCGGEDASPANFAHVTVKILAGRSLDQRGMLADSIFAILSRALPQAKCSVEITEMAKETYRKN